MCALVKWWPNAIPQSLVFHNFNHENVVKIIVNMSRHSLNLVKYNMVGSGGKDQFRGGLTMPAAEVLVLTAYWPVQNNKIVPTLSYENCMSQIFYFCQRLVSWVLGRPRMARGTIQQSSLILRLKYHIDVKNILYYLIWIHGYCPCINYLYNSFKI